jgi:hypothetical protein
MLISYFTSYADFCMIIILRRLRIRTERFFVSLRPSVRTDKTTRERLNVFSWKFYIR